MAAAHAHAQCSLTSCWVEITPQHLLPAVWHRDGAALLDAVEEPFLDWVVVEGACEVKTSHPSEATASRATNLDSLCQLCHVGQGASKAFPAHHICRLAGSMSSSHPAAPKMTRYPACPAQAAGNDIETTPHAGTCTCTPTYSPAQCAPVSGAYLVARLGVACVRLVVGQQVGFLVHAG